MRIFLTGANGYIGGTVASALIKQGHVVRGLVRDEQKAQGVSALGIIPVIGSLDDRNLLIAEAKASDGVVNSANSDHRVAVEALIEGLKGSGKPLLHTSGSSIVGDEAMGEPSDRIFYENTSFTPEPDKVARVAVDRLVLDAPGIRSSVLCNTMIYGTSHGFQSHQVPTLARQAKESGIARYIGRGLNRWSNVHIDDVASLYLLALEKAKAGTFFFVESSEESFANIVQAIADRYALGQAQSWDRQEALAKWGRELATFALGSNSRVRGKAGRSIGWMPQRSSVTDWIKAELK